MNPTQREIHERNQARFSQSEAGLPFSSHTSKQGRLFQVFAQRRELRGCWSMVTVIEHCTGSVNGWIRKEVGRYHGFSPISLLSDVSDKELIRDLVFELRKEENLEEEALLREIAEAMVAAFNYVAISGV